MNLYEIIISLEGMNFREREEAMDDMGVEIALRAAIHGCFKNNMLVRDSFLQKRASR